MSYTVTLNKAIAKYGSLIQQIVAMEEMSELQKEISKDIRGDGNRCHIAEEIADVQIMLEQLMLIHNCKTEVYEWRAIKMKRLRERMEDTAEEGAI